MSTGVLAMAHLYKRTPQVSMLVTRIQGDFIKKAVGRTRFTCDDGLLIKETIEDAILTREGRIITARSYGRNSTGEIVSQFEVTWSFRIKSNPL